MIKGNHVYTLMHDLKVLNQKLDNDELDVNVKISSNFHIMEDNGHVDSRMIDTIDDLIESDERPG